MLIKEVVAPLLSTPAAIHHSVPSDSLLLLAAVEAGIEQILSLTGVPVEGGSLRTNKCLVRLLQAKVLLLCLLVHYLYPRHIYIHAFQHYIFDHNRVVDGLGVLHLRSG